MTVGSAGAVASTVVFLTAGVCALAIASCSPSAAEDAGVKCAAGFLGTPSAPPDFDILALRADHSVVVVQDGDEVPMLFPPQGGRVIFVGVRATNVDGCALQLKGVLRDETTGAVRFESRPINLIPTADGWGASAAANEPVSIANFANVGVCPNGGWSATDLYGHEYLLEVTITDRTQRTLTKTTHVVPECGEPDRMQECLCICRASFVQSCADAGNGGDDSGAGE